MTTTATIDPQSQPHNSACGYSKPPSNMSTHSSLHRRRSKPGLVQTNLPTIPAASIPCSAISSSSVASSSQQASPIMSPQSTHITTNNSSVQGSPEGFRGRDLEILPTPLELPESIVATVSRRSSHNGLNESYSSNQSPGLIRRFSNRLNRSRRQSSTHASSREQSAGPVIVRRRTDSTSTAPDNRSRLSDSDDDNLEVERSNVAPYFGLTSSEVTQDGAGNPNGPSIADEEESGPVVPPELLLGSRLMKISKKKREWKNFVLDIETAKVSWDKNRPSKCFWIDDVTEIRSGSDARNYREEFGFAESDEPRFFSIIYNRSDKANGRMQKTIHVIAPDAKTFGNWTRTLDAISKHRHEFMWQLSAFSDKAVKVYWRREMNRQTAGKIRSEHDDSVDLQGVERICRNLHIHGAVDFIHSSFGAADEFRTGRLNRTQFQDFCRRMKTRADIATIYRGFASNPSRGLTLEEFLGFLATTQHEDTEAHRSHWGRVFKKLAGKFKPAEQALQDGSELSNSSPMSLTAFADFLSSKYNVPLLDMPETVAMSRPINEYFISSSHNTYLLGRQVAGQSSVEAYITTLKAGCRCVEIDCWDGNDGWPIVMHGRTMTTHVSFKDVLTVIAKYAFVKSKYPLWLSLEVHCNEAQQAKMAQIIRDTCGAALVTSPLEFGSETLPSPDELMNRICVKVKTPRARDDIKDLDILQTRSRGISIGSPFGRPSLAQTDTFSISSSSLPTSPPMSPYVRAARVLSRSQTRKESSTVDCGDSMTSSSSENESVNDDNAKSSDQARKDVNKQSKIIKSLGELGVYAAGIKFRGFDDAKTKQFNHIFSFAEGTFHRHNSNSGPESKRALVRHNMRYLMRVYPGPFRVASTNFDPLNFWRRGVQMVALNWQTYDLGMQMNDAMFAGGSDSTGYILKPSAMREITVLSEVPEEAGEGFVKRERKQVNFDIEVISAQQIMRPARLPDNKTLDTYIDVEVYHADDKNKDSKGVVGEGGVDTSKRGESSGLGTPHKRSTSIIKNNGYNPQFNKKFNFEVTTKFEDLIFVRFCVRNSRDGQNADDKGLPVAVYTAKLSSLKQGYRTLPLMDGNGNRFLFSTLFVRIDVKPTTSIYVDNTETAQSISKLKSIGRSVFARNPAANKSSNTEKLSRTSTLIGSVHSGDFL